MRSKHASAPAGTATANGDVPASSATTEGEGAAPPSAEGATESAQRGDARGKKKKRGPRPPQEGRERPAFTVGELVFGKILDVNQDAVLIDLSGKGLALFDRLELEIPDEPPTPAEARAHAAEEAAEAAREDAAERGGGTAHGERGKASVNRRFTAPR